MTGEPKNPLYFLLLITGILFCATALAYTLLPSWEEQANEAGQPLSPSPFRAWFNQDGWKLLLVEVAVLIVLGLASMALDHYRRIKAE